MTANNIKMEKLQYILAIDEPISTRIDTVMEIVPLKSVSLKNWYYEKDSGWLTKAIITAYLHNRLTD